MSYSDNYKDADSNPASRTPEPVIDATIDWLIESCGGVDELQRRIAERKPKGPRGPKVKYREGAQQLRIAWAVLKESRPLGEAIRSVTDESGRRIVGGSDPYKRLEKAFNDRKDEWRLLFDAGVITAAPPEPAHDRLCREQFTLDAHELMRRKPAATN